ncbi:MAG TPA: N-6 DNA methylase [Desulfobacteria bacterium]|nr:N-6 DNA methylase [Desulfobacteria bacterium]
MNSERTNGVFYTPPEVANFVADLAIPSSNSTVLDPCYGEGSLLLAAYSRLLELHSKSPKKQIFG